MRVAFLAIGLTLAPGAAEAACSAADLAGRWDAYVFGSQPEGTYTLRCALKINDRGRLRRSGSACDNDTTLGGQFTVERNCRFTVSLAQRFGPGQVIRCSYIGTLAKSKDHFAAKSECNSVGISLVNGIKR